jgi:hypothetical protein
MKKIMISAGVLALGLGLGRADQGVAAVMTSARPT